MKIFDCFFIQNHVIMKCYFFINILVVAFLILAYVFVANIFYSKIIVVLLFLVTIIQILMLVIFFKWALKSNSKEADYKERINGLKERLIVAEDLEYQRSIYFENLNYEVRTPLNTVFGMLNMLKQTNLTIDQFAQVEIAEYSSKHVLQLIDIVFENNKVNSNDLKLNISAIDLKADLSKLFENLEFQSWENNLEFEYTFLAKEKDRFLVLGDGFKIQQVLINLINNSIKYTHSGKISVIIDQTISIDNEQIITFYIKDTGIGMAPEAVKRIFDVFKGTDGDLMKMDYRGGGLGLLISHKLVALMGGELKFESKEQAGSTFYFSLQLKKTLNVRKVKEIQKPVLNKKFNVLVAEDNRMNQKVIKFLLERQGVDCTFAKNGLEAVNLYKILDFDLIFMDIYMPGMDGYVATKFIKETNKYALNKTPIIAVSASAFKKDIEKAKQAGINDFLAKPIDRNLLNALLIKYSKK